MPDPTGPPPHSPPDELPGGPRGIFQGQGAEEEIQKALAWYTAIFEGSRDAIFISDEESRFIAVNQAACTLAGYSRDELLAMRIPDLHEDQDLKAYRTFHDRIMSGEAIATEAKLLRKDGSKVDTEFSNRGIVVGGKAYMHTTARDVTERKWAEAALRDSEERFRTLVSQSPDGIFVADLTGKFVSVNEAACRQIGFSQAELLAMSFWDIVPESLRELHTSRLERILKGEILNDSAEYVARTKAGDPLFVEVRSAPHRQGGAIVGFQATVRDVTDRKRAEKALRASEEKYRELAERINDVLFATDEAGVITYISPVVSALAQFSPKELVGRPFFEFIHPEERPRLAMQLKKVLGGELEPSEYRILTKSGEERLIRTSSQPHYEEGRLKGLRGVMVDVTERKRAEMVLEESERRYRTFIDATSDMVFLKDEAFRYIISNRSNSQFFGLSESAVLGRTDFDLMPEAAAERCRKGDREVLERGQAITGEECVGSRVYQTVKFPVQLAGGHMGVGGYIRDITERRQSEAERRMLEEKLARSRTQAAVGQLMQGLAHEVRNPLFAIQVNAAVVAKSAPQLGDLAVHMDIMEGQIQRLDRLMKDMMELGQPLSDKEFIASALRDLLLAAMAGVDEEAPGSRQRVVFDVSPGLEVVGVPGKLILAFTHLLRNGLQQSPATGIVRVEAEKSDGSCHVRFTDQGPGIPPEHGTAIFEPFFTTRTGHRGLGLALVRHYVSAHGGTVTVLNNDPPPGACFTVRLPWGEREK